MRVINELIEDLGRLESTKSQVQHRINLGNSASSNTSNNNIAEAAADNAQPHQKPILSKRPSHSSRLVSHPSGISSSIGGGVTEPLQGSRTSVNTNTKINNNTGLSATTAKMKMVDGNEIEGVQFSRKRMNSSVSNISSVCGRSLSGDRGGFGDQVRHVRLGLLNITHMCNTRLTKNLSNYIHLILCKKKCYSFS